jgi:hypothetical protein
MAGLVDVVRGALDLAAKGAEGSGSVVGAAQANTLKLQIQSLSAGTGMLAAVATQAEEHPWLAVAGVALGAVAAFGAAGTVATLGIAGGTAYLGLLGITVAENAIVAAVAEAVAAYAIGYGVEQLVHKLGTSPDIAKLVQGIGANVNGWADGTIPAPKTVAIPADYATWGATSGDEVFNKFDTSGVSTGNIVIHPDGARDDTSLDTTNEQTWESKTDNYDATNRLTNESVRNDNGTSTKTVFDTGTEAWSSETSAFDAYQRLQSQRVVLDGGGQQVKEYDDANNRIWDERDVTTDPSNKVTDVQVKLNNQSDLKSATNSVDYSAIGQIFGSAIGRAIAGNDNQFKQLAVGTIAGFVGQKFVQTLLNGSTAINLADVDIHDVFFGNGVSLESAGVGAAASFLTAELATSIGLTGVGAQMFNAAVGGWLGSVLHQVQVDGFAVLTHGINWGAALNASEIGISTQLGSFLGHQLAPAESQYGAVGGQLAGAVGSALAFAFSSTLGTVLNIFLPGVGSFFGTIIGTLIGDAFAGDPANPKATHDVEILGSDYHFQNRLVGTDDHGNAAISKQMGDQVTAIVNNYLDTVHGMAIDHRGKVMIGYNSGAAPYPYVAGWFPNGTEVTPHFSTPTDAIEEGVRELLMQTEVVGGDLLMKRAHQVFAGGPHPDPNSDPTNFTDLVTLSGDLRTAQDYEQYLNDRETINALIELKPDSAFTAGWAATFARVKDLDLNHARPSDFLGGLMGYLDSVQKAGLNFDAANVSVKQSGSNVTIEIKVPNGTDVPRSLLVFADQTNATSDASGTTVQLVFANGIAAGGFHTLSSSGQVTGDTGNDLWFGSDSVANTFTAVSGSGNDILVGGAAADTIHGGGGWDFIDGGAGADTLFGEDGNDILRGGKGNDDVRGGAGNDTYVFNRGDGADTALDEAITTTSAWHDWYEDQDGTNIFHHDWVTTTAHTDGGSDAQVFGAGISISDVVVQVSGTDLIVGVKDPAHPGIPFAQLADKITLQHWMDPDGMDRIENFVFADGTTLNLAAGQSALTPRQIPFGATLSRNSVAENSANGTVVGTVTGFDLDAAAVLSYSLSDNPGDRFAINASTGVVTVANGSLLDFEANASQTIWVRTADQSGHVFYKPFTIAVTDVSETSVIEGSGSTSLTVVDTIYHLSSGGSGPSLKYFGAAVTFGQTGAFVPIAAERTAAGYDVAWKIPGSDQYLVWSADAGGNYLTNIGGVVAGSSLALDSLEPTFQQDLNGDALMAVNRSMVVSRDSCTRVLFS